MPTTMNYSERTLCQQLLNGPFDSGMLDVARARLERYLELAGKSDVMPEGVGFLWKAVDMPHPEDGGFLWKAVDLPLPKNLEQRRRILQCLAPSLLLDCVWLARVAQPATAHRATENRLFEGYCQRIGLYDGSPGTTSRFRANLALVGIALPTPDSPNFFSDSRFPEFALRLPLVHLTLLHRPRAFFPELLGYTLAHFLREPGWWESSASPEDIERVMLAWDEYPERELHAPRIRAGWNLYLYLFDSLAREIGEEIGRHPSPEMAMAELVAAKRHHAQGYHRRIRLAERSLDDWLAESAEYPSAFLQALRGSSWIQSACPEGSRLLRAMEFGGPMFGVFDEREKRICLDWIAASSNPEKGDMDRLQIPNKSGEPLTHSQMAQANVESRDNFCPMPQPVREPGLARPRLNPRRSFTALICAESSADAAETAMMVVERILFRTRLLSFLAPRHKRFFPYEPQRFFDYVERLHRREVERYRPLQGQPRLSREFCRWAALQLAPAILVDGAWLATIATAEEKLGETGRHLLRIYADELGNGRTEWNHPNVYRNLLDNLDFVLPPFDSEAFAGFPEFLDAAFSIPNYLLAIGLHSGRYLPEVLGLNLAIELSGLGAGYMGMTDVLACHGMDPTILRLHLSIDNLASGHAARAREAIMLYLDEVRRKTGTSSVDTHWRRIWRGYRSLDTATYPLALGFLLHWAKELG